MQIQMQNERKTSVLEKIIMYYGNKKRKKKMVLPLGIGEVCSEMTMPEF